MKTNKEKGILYICPTPLGNLEDITLRVLNTLKQVDYIACEDTRVTQKLLNHYNISTKLFSYHKFNERQKSNKIIELLNQGSDIALVSDAGTPLISDPGAELLKQTYQDNIKVVPLPGACALITALSATYLDNSLLFIFIGFLPKSNTEKENILNKYKDINIIFYESPNRLVKSLEDIHNFIGNCKVTVTRELTKIYEEFKTGKVQELIDYYKNKPPKGEITVIIHAISNNNDNILNIQTIKDIKSLQKQGFSTKEISKILSTLKPLSKKDIYNITLSLKKD